VASTYQTAIELAIRYGADQSRLLEVNADGSIRTQNWKEKLGNLGARITRRFDLRRDAKDAAVAAALDRLAQVAMNGINTEAKNIVRHHQQFPPAVLTRFQEARARVEQRNAPRNVNLVPAAQNPVNQASVTSLHQQGARNAVNNPLDPAALEPQASTNPVGGEIARASATGALPINAPNTEATVASNGAPAATPVIDLQALAQKYGVNPKIAGYLVGGGLGFSKVIQACIAEQQTARQEAAKKGEKYKAPPMSWGEPVARNYALLLDKTYNDEFNFVAIGRRQAITDKEIFRWAVAAFKQVQPTHLQNADPT
jgi:hypothetical protein